MQFKDFAKYWLPLLIYSGLIFYLSSQSQLIGNGFLKQIVFKDKIYHIIEYFILAFLIYRLLEFYKVKKRHYLAIILATAYGITDEIHQLFTPGRFFSWLDIVANIIGASLILTFKRITFKRKKH